MSRTPRPTLPPCNRRAAPLAVPKKARAATVPATVEGATRAAATSVSTRGAISVTTSARSPIRAISTARIAETPAAPALSPTHDLDAGSEGGPEPRFCPAKRYPSTARKATSRLPVTWPRRLPGAASSLAIPVTLRRPPTSTSLAEGWDGGATLPGETLAAPSYRLRVLKPALIGVPDRGAISIVARGATTANAAIPAPTFAMHLRLPAADQPIQPVATAPESTQEFTAPIVEPAQAEQHPKSSRPLRLSSRNRCPASVPAASTPEATEYEPAGKPASYRGRPAAAYRIPPKRANPGAASR